MNNATRQALWRSNHRETALAADRDRHRKLRDENRERSRQHPRNTMKYFIALDGEGAGVDALGRQNYQLLRAGDANGEFQKGVHAGGAIPTKNISDPISNVPRLMTGTCLEFILSMPSDAILVGYYFGYDVTQILRDLPPDRLFDLFVDKKDRRNRYTYWQSYGIEYVPKQYFRVCRIDRNSCRVIKNTSRTINEVGGFFQKSFVEAIMDWQIDDDATINMIASNKDRREQFIYIGAEENEYCKQECRLLAQLMTKFRQSCIAAKIVPRHWRGAGHIAARLHELHKTPRRNNKYHSRIFDKLAQDAYYGGRFEITTIGAINTPIWEYDINSAYPAAMLQLPCSFHGRWKRFRSEDEIPFEALYISDISFRHPDRLLCGLPIREKGRLYFPSLGSGIYWSPEIEAAKRIGAEITVNGGYYFITKCDCKPFDWVSKLYDFRNHVGSDTEGYPIKLGLNGLYGKFAQRIGMAPWRNYVMAGLITSFTRAKLINAFAEAPNDILYIATDALYSRRRLARIDRGAALGQWKESQRSDIFIVQPGIYWSSGTATKPKTRGIPRSIIIQNRTRFEHAWQNWLDGGALGTPPTVDVFVNQFIGLRAALARGRADLAGSWLSDLRKQNGQETVGTRSIDFDWNNKRRPVGDYIRGTSMVTMPFKGRFDLRSEGYDGEVIHDFQSQLIEREDDPDFVPWGNTGE